MASGRRIWRLIDRHLQRIGSVIMVAVGKIPQLLHQEPGSGEPPLNALPALGQVVALAVECGTSLLTRFSIV